MINGMINGVSVTFPWRVLRAWWKSYTELAEAAAQIAAIRKLRKK